MIGAAGRLLSALFTMRVWDNAGPPVHASPINFVDCHDLHGKNVNVFHTAIVANCFYRTDGDRRRF